MPDTLPFPDHATPAAHAAPADYAAHFGTLFAEALACAGVTRAVVSPGSRSTPLTRALAREARITAIPALDERTAAFFALGLAQASAAPVLLVCTSGTAAANYLPAIAEAWHAQVPLIVATADRPPELRGCGAGQTINQRGLYSGHVLFEAELPVPDASPETLHRWQTLLAEAYRRATQFPAGPVHLNIPLREPAAATHDADAVDVVDTVDAVDTAPAVAPTTDAAVPAAPAAAALPSSPAPAPVSVSVRVRPCASVSARVPAAYLRAWAAPFRKGAILAGHARPADAADYADAVLRIARQLRWPVFADVLNPVRHHAAPEDAGAVVVGTYEQILASPALAAELRPDAVLQLGQLPTGKRLRAWLGATPLPTLLISPGARNLNPLHNHHQILDCRPADLLPADSTNSAALDATTAADTAAAVDTEDEVDAVDTAAAPAAPTPTAALTPWQTLWRDAHAAAFTKLSRALSALCPPPLPTAATAPAPLSAPVAAHLLATHLPANAALILANSMSVRDAEHFWPVAATRRRVFCNRGANGIDGTLGTALGIAEAAGVPAVLLTGDLAFLHDTNALLLAGDFSGSLTVVVVNNNGGGIFDQLPVARDNPHFERFWVTPQRVNIPQLAAAYGVPCELIADWQQFARRIATLPARGLRILEIRTDRAADARLRAALLAP